MKLVRVITSACKEYECEYVCSKCGRDVNGRMNFCPECGRNLDKIGKPDSIPHRDEVICALIANAINVGIFNDGIKKGTASGESWSYIAEARPTK